jgi:hypothetical protein
MQGNITQDTIELLKAAMQDPNSELAKAWTQAGSAISGLTAYDLEAPAKTLYPVLTPLRNRIPRVSGKGGIQANWRAVTAINTAKISAGVVEGKRGGMITTTTTDQLAAYKGLGLEDSVTFEAQYAGQTFEDIRARAVRGLLNSLMIQEEFIILGGNGAAVASAKPTITLTEHLVAVSPGGQLKSATKYKAGVVALTLEGFKLATVAGGIVQTYSRTAGGGDSADTVNGGTGVPSDPVEITISTSGVNTQSMKLSCPVVPGAVAYAWYWGATASDLLLGAITTVNSYVAQTEVAAGTQKLSALAATDYAKNALLFDGLLYQCWKSGSGAYIKDMATGSLTVNACGTSLTAGTDGTITELDVMLQSMWDNYRLSPTRLIMASQEINYIRKKVLLGSTTAGQRFVFQSDQSGITGGYKVNAYLNPFGMGEAKPIPIEHHPDMPNGVIFADTDDLPYTLSGVTNVKQIRTRQEYYQIEWPLRTRKYEYGVYCDEVLQNYFPPAFGIIYNIAAG